MMQPGRFRRRARDNRRLDAWYIFSTVVALVLLASAGLKVHQLATRPLIPATWFDQRWVLSLGIVFEIVLAMVLLTRFAPRLMWAAATLTFVFFAGVSTWKGILGEASCGCFGVISVWPWYTLGLDLAVVGLLALFHPPLRGRLHPDIGDPRLAAAMGLSLLVSVPALWIAASYRPAPPATAAPPATTATAAEASSSQIGVKAEVPWSAGSAEFDLGQVFPGGNYELVVGLRNDGRAAIHIDTLFCECSCMKATLLGSRVVDPGRTAFVRLVCDIPEESSHYRKRVLIRGSGSEMVLTVRGSLPTERTGYQTSGS